MKFLLVKSLSLLLFITIAGCDGMSPGTTQANAGKPQANRFGGIPVDNSDSSKTTTNRVDPYDVDVSALEKRAQAGDAKAQFTLGKMHDNGDGVPKDAAKAAEWYQKAAEQGHADAQYGLGYLYYVGDGVPEDREKAISWIEKAAEQGFADAQAVMGLANQLGDLPTIPKNLAKAAAWYQKAAEQGVADSQFRLAMMYQDGEGVPKDVAKAVEWCQKAAEQGHANAQIGLALMYHNGKGMPKDIGKAVEWYEKAAAQGYAVAQTQLGSIYYKGIGVPKDDAKAAEWYQKAAAQGDVSAQKKLWGAYLFGKGVPIDKVLAYAWANLAASQGDEEARRQRDITALTSDQHAEAERLSSSWEKGQILRREAEGGSIAALPGKPTQGGSLKRIGTGTLFIVSAQGKAITNAHVVKDCAELHIESRDGLAKVTTTDAVNDLALIQIPGAAPATAPIARESGKLRQGEDIVVFGFPLNTVLSSGGNVTPGVVSAVTGLGNNSNQIQITAPIQPGSSGSPVINKKGEVVGVVSMKLSDAKMAAVTGSVGQNVNFAVSGQTLKAFLDAHEVRYKDGAGLFPLEKSPAELADDARKWTLVVECWR